MRVKKGDRQGAQRLFDGVFDLELLTFTAGRKAIYASRAHHEFIFIVATVAGYRIRASFTEISRKDFHGAFP